MTVAHHSPDCTVHLEHRPQVNHPEVHHIWPVGMGGPDVPENRRAICPTGHTNVHDLLRAALKAQGVDSLPWAYRRRFHTQERALARLGWQCVMGDLWARARVGG